MKTTTTTRTRKVWTTIHFGQYNGMTIPEAMLEDPDYVFWAQEKGVFSKRGELADECDEVCEKARRIRIPDTGNGKQSAKYLLDPKTKKFKHMEIVGEERRAFNKQRTIIKPVIDLSVARSMSPFDKDGSAQLVADMKAVVFGDPRCDLSADEWGDFFENDENFVL